jgi:hypothetical protein
MLELETIFGGGVVAAKAVLQTAEHAAMAANFALRARLRFTIPSIFSALGKI